MAKKPTTKPINTKPRETDLYVPLKRYLEGQGYEVKGEVGACDLVAVREAEAPVVVELKLGFTLALLHQGIARLKLSDFVYLAVPRGSGRIWLKNHSDNKSLCRRLGLGLITVRLRDGFVETHVDPGPYSPRKSKPRTQRLLAEFTKRVGDPNLGGASTHSGRMTAYRQDALRCLAHLHKNGATKGAEVAREAGVARATTIMRDDHYGWFERVEKGIYSITPKGEAACDEYADSLRDIVQSLG